MENGKPKSVDSRRVVSANQGAQETVSHFDTTNLNFSQPAIAPAKEVPTKRAAASRTKTGPSKKTGAVKIEVDESQEPSTELDWKQRSRKGLPSWLTSFILHVSLITSLALVSASGNGRKLVNLIGESQDSIDLTNPVDLDLKLETIEVSSETMQPDVQETELLESEDLSTLIDASVVDAASHSDSDDLFESVASAGLSGDKGLPGGAKFFGLDSEGSDFIFIVDCSGSMQKFRRWRQAKRELRNSINGLAENQRFLILLYNIGFVGMNDELELVPSTPKERRKSIRWLNRNYPDGNTFCAEALQRALELQPDAVFLLSDGIFDDAERVFTVLDQMNDKESLQRLNRRQIPVHTVALGNHDGKFAMEQIALENSGVFKLVD